MARSKPKQIRGKWSERNLKLAFKAVRCGTGINAAARKFKIPKSTLKRRIQAQNAVKGSMGRASVLGELVEKKIVAHILKLQKHGFCLTRRLVREIAFHLAERFAKHHPFNKITRLAGGDWLRRFLRRHPELSIRKAESVSLARAKGINKDTVDNYFRTLEEILADNYLFDKPENIFNMDETGLQLNNKPGEVIAERGSKNVAVLTSGERGETITVVACCNAAGMYLPPFLILKGKQYKQAFSAGLPQGSFVQMSQKSAYITGEIFLTWLKNHFVPHKPEGPVLLILDGHASHCNLPEMLEFAQQHHIILFALPSHTTHFLQPLDRAVFKSLKSNYAKECDNFARANFPSKKITRLTFGGIFCSAWTRAMTEKNARSAFRATGIVPFNPNAIPPSAFISEANDDVAPPDAELNRTVSESSQSSLPQTFSFDSSLSLFSQRNVSGDDDGQTVHGGRNQVEKSTVAACETAKSLYQTKPTIQTDRVLCENERINIADFVRSIPARDLAGAGCSSAPDLPRTASDMMGAIAPVPVFPNSKVVHKRARVTAEILNSESNIKKRKMMAEKKAEKNAKSAQKALQPPKESKKKAPQPPEKKEKTVLQPPKKKGKKGKKLAKDDSDDEDRCISCGDNYYETKRQDEWIQCIFCFGWLHEGCSEFDNACQACGEL